MYGNVAKRPSILKEFYTATQKETESVTTWVLRLEEILQKLPRRDVLKQKIETVC